MNLTKNTKLIIISCISILILISIYFFFFNDNYYENLESFDFESTNQTLNETITSISNNEVPNEIIVHITGSINNPGIIHLHEGDRISDAIDKAGGVTASADLNKINLAYLLEDAQKIYIPNTSDKVDVEYILSDNNNSLSKESTSNTEKNTASSKKDSSASSNKKSSSISINLNTASQQDLENLPGVGPSTAIKILDYRNENGKFSNIEDIKNVKGIGDSKYEKIKDYIYVK